MLSNAIRSTRRPSAAMTWATAVLMSVAALAAAAPVFAGLYLAKSALGLNLMAGPSPLHDLLYTYVR